MAVVKLFLTKKSIIGQPRFAAVSALQQPAKTRLYLLSPQSFWIKIRTNNMAAALTFKSSIIDTPRKPNQEDLFGIQAYQDGLIKYIKFTSTPITIALQGEWGSGKTSLMNSLKYNLCDVSTAPFFGIWINTWQFALLHSSSQAVLSILESIINQIGALNPNRQRWEKSKQVIGSIFKRMAVVGTKVATSTIGLEAEGIEEMFDGDTDQSSNVEQLKNEVVSLINEVMERNQDKRGFIFFIDDLDRIDPPLAVEILELLKNLFDLEHCVFVLAIDYNVVIKGLKPKFGELTSQNEREFRSFFDKIIQLPFSMPVASYTIDTFLMKALNSIAYLTTEEQQNADLIADLSEVAQLSVGTNPRSLKRLTNTLSLIALINQCKAQQSREQDASEEASDELDSFTKKISFSMVCIQIAFPTIYNLLLEEPDFKSWGNALASRLKAPVIDENMQESLKESEEFDEEWELTLFRICQKEAFLQQNAFNLSRLFNKVATMIDNDEELGEIVSKVLDLSAVTNIKANTTEAPAANTQKRTYNFDRSIYVFQGQRFTSQSKKHDVVFAMCQKYVADHPDCTVEQFIKELQPAWTFHLFISADYYNTRTNNGQRMLAKPWKTGYFLKGLTIEQDAIMVKDGGVFLTTFFDNLYMPWIIYHFKHLGYEAIILRDEDNLVYTYKGQKFGGKENGFYEASLDLIHALYSDFIAAHPEMTIDELSDMFDPEHYVFERFSEELKNDPYFDCNWRIDLPPLKDGRICMKTKMLKDKFETQLKRFREQGYEPEVSKVQQ